MILGFDPQKASENKYYAYKCWYNKNYEGNTLRISNAEIREIEKQWASQLNKWKLQAESIDQNGYDISDFEDSENFKAGQEKAKETSGHDGKRGKMIANNTGNIVGTAGSAIVAGHGVGKVMLETGFKGMAKSAAFVVTCPVALAIGILYMATRPNQKEHDALMQLKSLMESGGQNMTAAQANMEFTEYEILAEMEDGAENQKKTEEEIAEIQELIQLATAMYEEIVTRIENGEDVSPSERAKLPLINNNIKALNAKLETLVADAAASSENNEANIEAKQEEFGTAAETVEKEIGVTEFAAGFDKLTRDMCITQAVAQGLNVVTGTYGAIQAIVNSVWSFGATTAFAAMGFGGAAMSAFGVYEQSKWANDLNGELDTRANTESIGNDTWNVHEAKVSNSNMFLADVGKITEYFSDYEVPEYELSAIPVETPELEEVKPEPEAGAQSQSQSPNPSTDNTLQKKTLNPNDTTTA